MRFPRLIVFDLDFTLWDCGGTWCDCLSPPFRKRDDRVLDGTDRRIVFYDDVEAILDFCDSNGISMAVASRTQQPAWARELLELLDATDRFSFTEIYPSSKLKHLSVLRHDSGFDYESMLFFDDEMRNISEVSGLGVTSIFVENGISLERFRSGLDQFARGT